MHLNKSTAQIQDYLINGKTYEKLTPQELAALAVQKVLEINKISIDEIPDVYDINGMFKQLEADFEMQEDMLKLAANDIDNKDYDDEINLN